MPSTTESPQDRRANDAIELIRFIESHGFCTMEDITQRATPAYHRVTSYDRFNRMEQVIQSTLRETHPGQALVHYRIPLRHRDGSPAATDAELAMAGVPSRDLWLITTSERAIFDALDRLLKHLFTRVNTIASKTGVGILAQALNRAYRRQARLIEAVRDAVSRVREDFDVDVDDLDTATEAFSLTDIALVRAAWANDPLLRAV